jgi:hypothetical protein
MTVISVTIGGRKQKDLPRCLVRCSFREVPTVHETVELIKAIAWPCVVVYFLLRFNRQIASLLNELPNAVQRLRSAHGLGVEIELDKIGGELTIAEQEAKTLSLQMPMEPKPTKTEEGD